MELDPKLVASLKRAIDAMPDDVELRLHLATLLIEGGRREEGIREVGIILQADPANAGALALITGTPTGGAGAPNAATELAKPGAAEQLPEAAHALPPVSFQCVVWRNRSRAPASATISAKNTTTIAEAYPTS